MQELLNSSSLPYIENLYLEYLQNPDGVDPAWQNFFRNMSENGSVKLGPSFKPSSIFNPSPATQTYTVVDNLDAQSKADTDLQHKVGMLIRNYRVRGHIMADLDPLGLEQHELPYEMTPECYGWSSADMSRVVKSGTMEGFTLAEVFERLKTTYCRRIGVQFMHIDDFEVRRWLQSFMEYTQNRLEISHEAQLRILEELTSAVVFEEFIQKKFVGVKSFSLTGAESLIPLLTLAIQKASENGVEEVVLGMAHRGRLNVLANICGKPERQIFREFFDTDVEDYIGRGDVKYHLGYSQNITTRKGKKIHVSLSFNPSHLEFINPVVMGRVRAKQDRHRDVFHEHALGILIHGDAAFIGEGVVQETLNLSELKGYRVGGLLHIILNNQVGFTTLPKQGRSTTYATDVAKMLQSPIFHVNGEDPEAVAQVVNLAMEFRSIFRRDVVIDMYCYRRFGHNEADEPAFTQPLMYKAIKKHKGVREGYLEYLQAIGKITRAEADNIAKQQYAHLEKELEIAKAKDYKISYQAFDGLWKSYKGGLDKDTPEVPTGISKSQSKTLLTKLSQYPKDFTPHKRIQRILQQRLEMAEGKRMLDWANAEALALGSLATEGHRIRMSGQDVERGTFSHRHAVLHDMNTDSTLR